MVEVVTTILLTNGLHLRLCCMSSQADVTIMHRVMKLSLVLDRGHVM